MAVTTAENIIPSHWKIIASSMENISTPDDPLPIKGLNQILDGTEVCRKCQALLSILLINISHYIVHYMCHFLIN